MLSKTSEKYSLIGAVLLEVLLIAIGLSIYTLFPFFQFYFNGPGNFGISESNFIIEYGLYYLAMVYAMVIPVLFYSYYKSGTTPKSTIVFQKIKNQNFDKEFWFCIRSFILKFLYIPLMFLGALYFGKITMVYLLQVNEIDFSNWNWTNWINDYFYALYINAVMTFVLIIYAFSYCVESEFLNNKIKSVDDSWFSWIVALICYLPLYPFVFYVIPMASQDSSFFINHEITAFVRILVMLIIGLKAWSIITLGTKSTNLTNRGIVVNGPYSIIRHPHYVTKMIVKWILVLPVLWGHFWLIGGMIFWTTIYMLRALTEEQHLKKDSDYQEYMKKVKWKFIPGVI